MPDILPPIESWKARSRYGLDITLSLPTPVTIPKPASGQTWGEWTELLVGSNTADDVRGSAEFRNWLAQGLIETTGYLHTHDGLYEPDPGGTAPDATLWHTHYGVDILTAGPTSDADALHTHAGLVSDADLVVQVQSIVDDYIDLDLYVLKSGSITQLSDITSTGTVIEAAIAQAHDESHTIASHSDTSATGENLNMLTDGSNADCLHTHSWANIVPEHNDLDGLNSGDYLHLTAAQYVNFGTLTDGSNADALHTHSGTGGGTFDGVHNDLDGLQGGTSIDPSADPEYYHLNYNEYISLIGGPSVNADDYHTHAFGASADEIPLGTPTDGDWTDGIITTWTPTTWTADAIDDLNETMGYLAPADAGSMDGQTLTTTGVSTYTGRLSAGNTNYPSGSPAGSSYTRIINDGTFNILSPNQSTSFNKADEGVLRYYINGVENDSVDLASNFVEGERDGTQSTTPWVGSAGNLSVTLVTWYNSFPAWQRGNATMYVVPGDLRQGYNYFDLKHDLGTDQDASTLEFFYDTDAGSDPSVNTPTVTENTKVTKWLSGIDHYYRGSTFDVDVIGSDCFDNVYHSAPYILRIRDLTDTTIDTTNIDYDDATVTGLSNPPVIGETMTVTNKLITIRSAQVRSINARYDVTPSDPYGDYTSQESASANRLVDAYTTTSTDVYEYFDDENRRLPAGAYDSVPGAITGQWTSSTALTNGQTQVFNGRLYYPTIDFTSGYLPTQGAGRDYSGFSGNQVYYRAFYDNGNPHSSGQLELGNLSNSDVGAVGNGNINVEIKVPTETGWLDLGTAYDSGTFTGSDGDGCRTSQSGDDWSWTCGTFTTGNSGYMIIVRVTFRNSNTYITQIRELGW